MAILLTDRVGERNLGMVMVFCHPNQAKMEACDALSALCQYDSSEPSVGMVRRYSNTPYIPQGMTHSLIWMLALFQGALPPVISH